MNKVQALKHAYKCNRVIKKVVDKLIMIKPGMNACDIAKKCQINMGNVYSFARKYKVKLFNRAKKNYDEAWVERVRALYLPKWDKNDTIMGNSRKLGITYSYAMHISSRFHLNDSVASKMRIASQRKLEKIRQWRSKGLSDAEIARVIGITRERVRQLSIVEGK